MLAMHEKPLRSRVAFLMFCDGETERSGKSSVRPRRVLLLSLANW
jgi:hypothetical protein